MMIVKVHICMDSPWRRIDFFVPIRVQSDKPSARIKTSDVMGSAWPESLGLGLKAVGLGSLEYGAQVLGLGFGLGLSPWLLHQNIE